MEFQVFQQISAVVTPFILAGAAALRAQLGKHADKIADMERQIMQQRIDLSREMVGRHEIERLGAVINHLVSITEQTGERVERLAERMDRRV